jgi:hypothetical protein
MQGGLDAASDSVGGRVGAALRFDGGDDYVDVPTIPLSGSVTMAAWVRLDPSAIDTGFIKGVVAKGQFGADSEGDIRIIFMPDNTVRMHVATTTGTQRGDNAFYDLSNKAEQWVHITAVHDDPADTVRLYIDGSEVSVDTGATGTMSSNSRPIHIGGYPNWGAGEIAADIDDVRLYNRALTADEVREIYESQDGVKYNRANRVMEYFDGNRFVAMTPAWPEPDPNPQGTGAYVPNAVYFDGGDDFIDSGGYTVPPSQQMTISFWFNRNTITGNDWIFRGDTDGGDRRFEGYLTSGGDLIVGVEDEAGLNVVGNSASFAPDTGAWHHYIMSFDAATGDAHVYVNDTDNGCCSGGHVGVGRTPEFCNG